ncbi:hypothetical protein BH11BAC4_BH11BAC4_22320 [soil metagenome]
MLKIITATIFLLAFASQTFYKAFIIFDYAANTRAYAKNCVNKARPKMHCNGKCQVMKKLQEEERKDAQNAERKSENKNENILSSKSFFATTTASTTQQIIITYPSLQAGKVKKMPRAVFHPPTA